MTFHTLADASEVSMKLIFLRGINEMLPVFGTEHEMDVIFYE
jgi:hypothetical protein